MNRLFTEMFYYFCVVWLICLCDQTKKLRVSNWSQSQNESDWEILAKKPQKNGADICAAAFPAHSDTAAHQPAASECVCECVCVCVKRWQKTDGVSSCPPLLSHVPSPSFQWASLTREVPGDEHGGQNGSLQTRRREEEEEEEEEEELLLFVFMSAWLKFNLSVSIYL